MRIVNVLTEQDVRAAMNGWRGERVILDILRRKPRHRGNAGTGRPPRINVRNVITITEQDIAAAMSGEAGEEVIMDTLKGRR